MAVTLSPVGVKRISASDSTFTGTVRITGGPNITVGTDASGVSISGATAGAASVTMGMSNLGNTAGSTGVVDSRMLVVGGPNITVSQSTEAGLHSATLSISAAADDTAWKVRQGFVFAGAPDVGGGCTSQGQDSTHSRIHFVPFADQLEGSLSVKTIAWFGSRTTVSSTSFVGTAHVGVYTLNASTLSLISSTSNSYSLTTSAEWASLARFEISGLSDLQLTPRDNGYWLGFRLAISTGAIQINGAGTGTYRIHQVVKAGSDQTTSATSVKFKPGAGIFSSAALPNSAALNAIAGQAGNAVEPCLIISEIPLDG